MEPTEADKALARDIMTQYTGSTYGMDKACDRIVRAIADAREQARPPLGHVLTDDGTVRAAEARWECPYCGVTYAEYVNGCPRCHHGEPGTATSVRRVLIVRSAAEAAKTSKEQP